MKILKIILQTVKFPQDNKKRLTAASTIYKFFKHAIEISNENIIRNADHSLRKSKKDVSNNS